MSQVHSLRRFALRIAATVAVALAAVPLVAPPSPAQRAAEGYRYTFRIVTGDDGPTTGRAWVLGDQARIELDESNDAKGARSRGVQTRYQVGGDGGYLVLTDGGRTVLAISPSEREYSSIETDSFERLVGTAMRAADKVLTLEVDGLSVTGQRLGAGGPILGHPTQRGRITADYAARIGALGFTTRFDHHVETDYWVAPGLRLPRNPLAELLVNVPTVLAQHDADFVERMGAGRRALVDRGTPLRVVLTSTSVDAEGKRDTTTASYEITSLTRAQVDPALFAVPKGYAKKDGFSWVTGK